jgi:hypothetical protein
MGRRAYETIDLEGSPLQWFERIANTLRSQTERQSGDWRPNDDGSADLYGDYKWSFFGGCRSIAVKIRPYCGNTKVHVEVTYSDSLSPSAGPRARVSEFIQAII